MSMQKHALFVRRCVISDVRELARLDEQSYPGGGMRVTDLERKCADPQSRLLVLERETSVIGFGLCTIVEPGNIPESFCDLKTGEPPEKTWMFISAFTTVSNFSDPQTDEVLLNGLEKEALLRTCTVFCVPLTEDHPYKNPPYNVFEFWEERGYELSGSIQWQEDSGKKHPCRFYRKWVGTTKR